MYKLQLKNGKTFGELSLWKAIKFLQKNPKIVAVIRIADDYPIVVSN